MKESPLPDIGPGEGDGIMARVRETFELFVDVLEQRAIERNLTAAEVLAKFKETELFDPVVDVVEASILDRQPAFAAEIADYHEGFSERLRAHYGEGFDGFRSFISICIESTSDAHTRGSGQIDLTGEVLLDLHARACLVSNEIYTLLTNGYPYGALAAWRTVHELSVVASIMDKHGRDNGADLTNRWIACDAVLRLKDALIYQERHERLGYEPLTDEDLRQMQDDVDEAIKDHGSSIAQSNGYGWAVEICKPKPANFRTLEELAGRDHLRGHYRWASHRVHGDSRGNEHNWITRGDQSVRLAGPTNSGLVDAADLTLSSLLIATNCVLAGLRDDGETEYEEVAMMLTLGRLRERVVQHFVDAQAKIDAAEAALFAEEAAAKAAEPEEEFRADQ